MNQDFLVNVGDHKYKACEMLQVALDRRPIPGFNRQIKRAEVFGQNNTTMVVIETADGELYPGWTKFNPNDKSFNEEAGINRAMSRAINALIADSLN